MSILWMAARTWLRAQALRLTGIHLVVARLASKARQAHKDLWALPVPPALRARLVRLVLMELMARTVRQARKAFRDRKAFRAHRDRKVFRVLRGRRAFQAHKGR